MPMLKRPDAEIHYEVHGAGFPDPALRAGRAEARRSRCGAARRPPIPTASRGWTRARRSPTSTPSIAMDQRNAGKSVADVKPDHGWHTFAADHSRADGPSRLREVPRHGRLHRRQLLLRGDRAGARSRRRGGAAESDRPVGEPRHLGRRGQGLRRDGARAAIRRSPRRPSSRSARTCSAPTSCSPSPATS